jgi:hypothetical protein
MAGLYSDFFLVGVSIDQCSDSSLYWKGLL